MSNKFIGRNNNYKFQMFGNNNNYSNNQLSQEDLTPEQINELADLVGSMGENETPEEYQEWYRKYTNMTAGIIRDQISKGDSNSKSGGGVGGGNDSDNTIIAIIAGISVVAFVAIIGAAIFIVKRNRRRKEESYKILPLNNPTQQPPQPPQIPQPQQPNQIPIIIQPQQTYCATTPEITPNVPPPAYSIEDGNSDIGASTSVNTNRNRNTSITPSTSTNQENTEILSSSSRATNTTPAVSNEQSLHHNNTQRSTQSASSVMHPAQPIHLAQPVGQTMQPLLVKKSLNEPLPQTMMVGNQLYVLADPNFKPITYASNSPSLSEKRPLYPPNYSYTIPESTYSSKRFEATSSTIQVPVDATPVIVPHLNTVRPVQFAPQMRPLTPPLSPVVAMASVPPRPVSASYASPSTALTSTAANTNEKRG